MTTRLAIRGGDPLRSKPFPAWPITDRDDEHRISKVLKSGVWSYGGPFEDQFSREWADFCGAQHAFCVSNGSVALEIALRACGVGPGDEVIVPALTWTATAWAVVQVGAQVVFADVDRSDWCLDPNRAEEAITDRTRALVPVHLYNQVAPIERLLSIGNRSGLHVIEDCAHAHGSKWKGRSVGTFGAIGSFSFQQSKGMTSGEGGILITDRESLADQIHGLKNCGRPWRENTPTYGGNHRITEFQAALLIGQLSRLAEQLTRKNERFEYFRDQVRDVRGIVPIPPKSNTDPRGMLGVPIQYDPTAFVNAPRDLMVEALLAEGIPALPCYEPVYLASIYRNGANVYPEQADRMGLRANCPVAEQLSATLGLILPHSLFLGEEQDIDDIVGAFRKISANATDLKWPIAMRRGRQTIRRLARRR